MEELSKSLGRIVQGKGKKNTIILEAACDYNHYFWHASFGFPGSLNDVNVLRFSSLYKSFYDGSLHKVEEASGMVPYTIGTETFDKVFFLTDGIYPPSERFVKPIASPIGATEKNTRSGKKDQGRILNEHSVS
jgi:hypothetical protein